MKTQRQSIELLINEARCDRSRCSGPHQLTLPVDEAPAVDFETFTSQHAYRFAGKLPAVRHISFATDMALVAIVQIQQALLGEVFQPGELFDLMGVNQWVRLTFYPSADPFISSAKAFKKDRKVDSLTALLPSLRLASQSAFANWMRWRLALTACNTLWASLLLVMSGFRPRPVLIFKPSKPLALNRWSQLFTLTWHIPTMLATSFDVRPFAFSRIAWQRIRNEWLSLVFNSFSNSTRCFSVKTGVFTRPMRAS